MRRLITLSLLLPWMTFAQASEQLQDQTQDQEQETLSDKFLDLLEKMDDLTEVSEVVLSFNPDLMSTTATKTELLNSQTPVETTIFDADVIRKLGFNSVGELLKHVPGFIENNALNNPDFSVRGINAGTRANNRILKVMINGQPVGWRSNSQNYLDASLLPISAVARVEIVKGPISALYGANAFMGVVNIVTRSGQQAKVQGTDVRLGFKDGDNTGSGYGVSASGGNQSGDWEYFLSAAAQSDDRSGLELPLSSPGFDQSNDRIRTNEDDYNSRNLFAQFSYTHSENQLSQLSVYWQEYEADNNFSDLNPLVSSGVNTESIRNAYLRYAFAGKLAPTVSLNADLTYASGEPTDEDRVEIGASDFYLTQNARYDAVDLRAELNWQVSQNHHWLFGADVNSEQHRLATFNRVDRNSGVEESLSENREEDIDNVGVFVQWLGKWDNNWQSLLGYRIDNHNIFDNEQSYRLGLVIPGAEGNQLKIMAGSSFQAPSPELLFRAPVQIGDIKGNPDLTSQQSQSFEISYTGPFEGNTFYRANVYYNHIDDLVNYQDQLRNLVAINSGSADAWGVELELMYQDDIWLYFINGSYQETDRKTNSLSLLESRAESPTIPRWRVNFGVAYHWLEYNLRFALTNRYTDKRSATDSNVLEAEAFYDLDESFDSDLSITYKMPKLLGRSSEIQLKVNDVWGSDYVLPGYGGVDLPSKGREWTLLWIQKF